MEGGVWYMVALMALMVGVISKKYLFRAPPPPNSPRLHGYPDSGDLMTELRDKWNKPVEALPVNVDIPRLARKISVFTSTEENPKHPVLLAQDNHAPNGEPTGDNLVIKELLYTLSKYLGDPQSTQTNINTTFMDYFKRTADPSLALADFLSAVVGHDSLTCGVLKACNQSVLAPGVLKLKFAIGNHYPYKDLRGSWKIEVVIGPDWVTVEHLKRERSFDDAPAHAFEFAWSLKLTFDRYMQVLRGTELHIEDISLNEAMSQSTKKKVGKVLLPFFRHK